VGASAFRRARLALGRDARWLDNPWGGAGVVPLVVNPGGASGSVSGRVDCTSLRSTTSPRRSGIPYGPWWANQRIVALMLSK